MAKVTSKLQVTIPKAIAKQYGIKPGDEIEFIPAGDVIRIAPPRLPRPRSAYQLDAATRVALFDAMMERQAQRERERGPLPLPPSGEVRWTREDYYDDRRFQWPR